jgi:hypothetical protein
MLRLSDALLVAVVLLVAEPTLPEELLLEELLLEELLLEELLLLLLLLPSPSAPPPPEPVVLFETESRGPKYLERTTEDIW